MNVFLGIPISEQDSEILTHLVLQEHPHWEKHRDIRWTAAQNLHLTLHFLGSMDPKLLSNWVTQLFALPNKQNSLSKKLKSIDIL